MVPKKVSELVGGEVLAQDVYDLRGSMILAKATKLTPQFISMLRNRGIPQVLIQSNDPELIKAFEEKRNSRLARVNKVFSSCDNDVMINAIRDSVLDYYKNNFVEF